MTQWGTRGLPGQLGGNRQGVTNQPAQTPSGTSISPQQLLELEQAYYQDSSQLGPNPTTNLLGTQSAAQGAVSNMSISSQYQMAQVIGLLKEIAAGDVDAGPELVAALGKLTTPELTGIYRLIRMGQRPTDNTPNQPAPATDTPSQSAGSATASSGAGVSAASQARLKAAEALFNANHYKQAYAAYEAALREDPSIATQWPEIYYQLGASAEYSNDSTLIKKAQSNYERYLAAPGADPKTAAWVRKELKTGLPAQILIQSAGTMYQANNYDGAYAKYAAALKADPSLATTWPTILYQLGTSAEYAKSPALNDKAVGYYNQYLNSPKPDPQTATWVTSEVGWLGQKGAANSMVDQAKHEMYDMQNPGQALTIIENAMQQYPQLAKRQPDVLYTAADYAYANADIPAAKRYLALATTAMAQQQPSGYSRYWNQQIASLDGQIKDPWGNGVTWLASQIGDKVGGRAFWQQLLQGVGGGWGSIGRSTRLNKQYNKSYWESDQYAGSASKNFGTGEAVQSSTARFGSMAEKQEFDTLNAEMNSYARAINASNDRIAQIDEALAADPTGPNADELKDEKARLQDSDDPANKARLDEISAELKVDPRNKALLEEQATLNQPGVKQLTVRLKAAEAARNDLVVQSEYPHTRDDGTSLSRTERKAVHAFDKEIRAQEQHLASLIAATPRDEAAVKAVQKQLEDYALQRDGLLGAARHGPMEGALYTAQVWHATTVNEIQNRNKLQAKLKAEQAKAAPDQELVKSLTDQIAAANKNIDAAYLRYSEVVKTIPPKLQEAQGAVWGAALAAKHVLAEHDALIEKLRAAGKTDAQIEADPRIRAFVAELQTAAAKASKNDREYRAELENHPGGMTGASSDDTDTPANAPKSNPFDHVGGHGPGWWGVGTTLDRQQAVGAQWSLGQNADQTENVFNEQSGLTSGTTNDASQQGVTLQKGGTGVGAYTVQANAVVNVANAEHRDYSMLFSGHGSAGLGFGGQVGTQVRADIADADVGLNTSAGGKATIGDETIGNNPNQSLVSSSLTGQAALGTQADADVSMGLGKQDGAFGAAFGGGAGAFAGAQAAGMASGSVAGVGGGVMGQAWAGAGAKANANFTYRNGVLDLNVGAGAALGIGGYLSDNVQINLGQLAQEVKGIGSSAVSLAKKWGDKVPGLGDVAGFVAGAIGATASLGVDIGEAGTAVALHTVTGAVKLLGDVDSEENAHAQRIALFTKLANKAKAAGNMQLYEQMESYKNHLEHDSAYTAQINAQYVQGTTTLLSMPARASQVGAATEAIGDKMAELASRAVDASGVEDTAAAKAVFAATDAIKATAARVGARVGAMGARVSEGVADAGRALRATRVGSAAGRAAASVSETLSGAADGLSAAASSASSAVGAAAKAAVGAENIEAVASTASKVGSAVSEIVGPIARGVNVAIGSLKGMDAGSVALRTVLGVSQGDALAAHDAVVAWDAAKAGRAAVLLAKANPNNMQLAENAANATKAYQAAAKAANASKAAARGGVSAAETGDEGAAAAADAADGVEVASDTVEGIEGAAEGVEAGTAGVEAGMFTAAAAAGPETGGLGTVVIGAAAIATGVVMTGVTGEMSDAAKLSAARQRKLWDQSTLTTVNNSLAVVNTHIATVQKAITPLTAKVKSITAELTAARAQQAALDPSLGAQAQALRTKQQQDAAALARAQASLTALTSSTVITQATIQLTAARKTQSTLEATGTKLAAEIASIQKMQTKKEATVLGTSAEAALSPRLKALQAQQTTNAAALTKSKASLVPLLAQEAKVTNARKVITEQSEKNSETDAELEAIEWHQAKLDPALGARAKRLQTEQNKNQADLTKLNKSLTTLNTAHAQCLTGLQNLNADIAAQNSQIRTSQGEMATDWYFDSGTQATLAKNDLGKAWTAASKNIHSGNAGKVVLGGLEDVGAGIATAADTVGRVLGKTFLPCIK